MISFLSKTTTSPCPPSCCTPWGVSHIAFSKEWPVTPFGRNRLSYPSSYDGKSWELKSSEVKGFAQGHSMSVSAKPNKPSGPTTPTLPALPDRPLGSWASSRVCFPRLPFTVEATHLPTSCPLSRWAGAAGRCSLWGPCTLGRGQQSRRAGLGGGQGRPLGGPQLWCGRDRCADLLVQVPGQAPWGRGEEPGWDRRGSGNQAAHDRAPGSLWGWEVEVVLPDAGPSRGRPPPPLRAWRPATRAGPGRPETCLTPRGRMRAGLRAAS